MTLAIVQMISIVNENQIRDESHSKVIHGLRVSPENCVQYSNWGEGGGDLTIR